MKNNIQETRVKLYGIIPLKKKQFLIYEITSLVVLVIMGIIFLKLPKTTPGENNFLYYYQENGIIVILLAIFLQVIEGLVYYNKFTREQLKIIKLQQDKLVKSEKKLNELNQSKDKFFAIIAHDVKNPFTALLSASQTMANNFELMDKEDLYQGINIIKESSNNIYALFENLLIWANSQMGNMQISKESIGIRFLVEEAIKPFLPSLKEKHISLETDIDPDTTIVADKNMINTVLRNLLSNATKFTGEKGIIQLNSITETDKILIEVSDTGPGLSSEDQAKLFRIDVKNKSIPGEQGKKGSGLGLILCKEFMEKNDGKIAVRSEIGKGTTFILTFRTGRQ